MRCVEVLPAVLRGERIAGTRRVLLAPVWLTATIASDELGVGDGSIGPMSTGRICSLKMRWDSEAERR